MKASISINSQTCIKCRKCIRVCPAAIFTQADSGSEITLRNIETCIVCGHCAAVCPTGSVCHSEFPAERLHHIDYTQYPSPEQMMLLCKARRSNRAFSKRQIPSETLDYILEAAHRAPTASNMQQVAFTLVTDPEKLKLISDSTINVFSAIVRKIENPLIKPILKIISPHLLRYIPVFNRLKREYALGNDGILRGATAVILIHTPAANRFGCQDANLAYQNASLMAETLGVSQFYTGFVCSAIQQDKGHAIAKAFGIEGKIHAGMALGLPEFRYSNYIDKKQIVVDLL